MSNGGLGTAKTQVGVLSLLKKDSSQKYLNKTLPLAGKQLYIMQAIIKKFKFKNNGVVINAPKNLEIQFVELGFKTSFDKKIASTNTLVFINNNKEYLDFLNTYLNKIETDSVLWFAYPKGTSKVKTDIHRDTIRTTGEQFNITTVAAISINDTWSALRFRPIDKVGK